MIPDIAELGLKVDSGPVKKGTQELDKFSKSSKRAEQSNDKNTRSAKRMGASYKMAAAGVASAVAAFVSLRGAISLLQKFIRNTSQADEAIMQLNTVLRSTRGVSGLTRDGLLDMAAALQKTTRFGDETVVSAQALLLTFTRISGEVFPDALTAVLNVATAMKTDLKSAAIQVGKALNDPIMGMTALSRSGITFTDTQKDMVKKLVESNDMLAAQTIILKELETQFGGSAKAARGTLGGAIEALSNTWNDLFEIAGGGSETLRKSIETLITKLEDPRFVTFVQMIGTRLFEALSLVIDNAEILTTIIGVGLVAAVGTLTAVLMANPIVAFATVIGGITIAIYENREAIIDLAFALGNTGIDAMQKFVNAYTFMGRQLIVEVNSMIASVNGLLRKAGLDGFASGGIGTPSSFFPEHNFGRFTKTNYGTPWPENKSTTGTRVAGGIDSDNKSAAVRQESAAIKDATSAMSDYSSVFSGFFQSLQQGLRNSESFWESFGNAANRALDSIISKTVDMAANQLFTSLFGGVISLGTAGDPWSGMRSTSAMMAGGGGVRAGSSYMVGEKGPERFTAPANGVIQPNDSGSNVQVNVINNSGEKVEERRRSSGNLDIVDIVVGTMNKAIDEGRTDSSLGNRFGATPNKRRR